MVPTHKPTSSFGKWLFTYKKTIFLILFFLVIPLLFISIWYIGDYIKYSNVNFSDVTVNNFSNTEIYVDEQNNHEIIKFKSDNIIFEIKLRSITIPEFVDEKGYYVFRSRYSKNGSQDISNVRASYILQTDWMNARSEEKSFNILESFNSNQSIEFNTKLPKSPLPFIEIQRPHLYIKLSYSVQIGLGQFETKTDYIKVDLTNLTPYDVIDANKK